MLSETELQAWADDEFVVAHILSSYITEYTHLEECLAIGSFAQDELAHARAFYEYSGLCGRDLDRYIFLRTPDAFAVTPLATYQPGNFAELVVKQYLYEVLDRLRLDTAQKQASDALQTLLTTMRSEERMHYDHWIHWIHVLADSPARSRLESALEKVGAYCGLSNRSPAVWDISWYQQAESELLAVGLRLGQPDTGAVVAWQGPFAALIERMQSIFREHPEVILG